MNKKGLIISIIAAVMMMSASATVFAGEVPTIGTGTPEKGAAASIVKDFEMAEGLTVPEVSFNFTATKITEDAPEATITDITYSSTDDKGSLADGKYTISKESEIAFGTFPHAGLYEYTVKETKGDKEGIIYALTSYTLRVYVANKDGGDLYVKTITAGDSDGKKDKILFTNTYVKNNCSLEIEKKTVGDLADKSKDFEFTITIIKSATDTAESPIYAGAIGSETVNVPVGTPTKFKLHDSEKLVFDKLPAGTRYIVTETGVKDGYTPSVQVTENGIQGEVVPGNDKDDLSSATETANNLVGENDNKVTFTNTYYDMPITGLVLNNLPFIMLVAFAVLAFGLLAVAKRRKSIR